MGKTSDAKESKQNPLERGRKSERPTKANNFKSKFKGKSNSKDEETKPKKVFDKKQWRLKKYNKQYQVQQWQDRKKKAVLREYYKKVQDNSEFDVQKIYKQAEEQERASEEVEENQEETENENNLNRDISEEQAARISNEAASTSNDSPPTGGTKVKSNQRNAYKKAHNEFERLKLEKQLQKEEAARIKAEKIEAKKQYKAKKLEKYKLLNKRTKKGQPIMKYRMEMLLEQIQKSVK